ncbi:MAG: DUF4442 domain-containing protein [Deltaproteobacteria bacterium]|nr:DUF4442 domain-containing protein [Deltaproteobacteria bacterium]
MNLQTLKATVALRAFGWVRIPMIAWLQPTVVHVSDERLVVKLPLTWRSRNHLKSMYFGALAVGADCACGLLAMQHVERHKRADIALLFKDFSAQFHRRPDGDVHFACEAGTEIRELVARAARTGERCNLPVTVTAHVPSKSADPVATFVLTLSLKARGKLG